MQKLTIGLLSGIALLVVADNACAYLDPGTGSMLVQALLAVVAAASVSIGIFWRRINLFLGRLFGRKKDGE